MGSVLSRGASKSARQFPSKADASSRLSSPLTASATRSAPSQPPTSHPPRHPSSSIKSDEILRDAEDPDYGSMLRTLGAVKHTNNPNLPPMPKSSYTPTTQPNPTQAQAQQTGTQELPTSLLIMRAREQQAHAQSANPEAYMTVFTLREVIALRERRNKTDEEIETMLKLKRGTLSRLGDAVGSVAMKDERSKEKIVFAG